MIKCQICGKEFNDMITHSHLKQHGITCKEYKEKYGPVVSKEYSKAMSERNSGENNPNFGKKHTKESRAKMSQKLKGHPAHNKGMPMSEEQKQLLSIKAQDRCKKWKENGNHPSLGRRPSEETRQKTREARAKQVITSEQAKQAMETRKRQGTQLSFRGHNHTDESKKKISARSIIVGQKKAVKSIEDMKTRLLEYGYTFISIENKTVTLQCNACGYKFTKSRQQLISYFIHDKLCKICHDKKGHGTSETEKEIADFIRTYIPIVTNSRSIIEPNELDIVIPDKNIAIEYDGRYWHSSYYKEDNYHLNKTQECEDRGIRLIHIFDDDWFIKTDITKAKLKEAIGHYEQEIPINECIISEIDYSIANEFLIINDLNGMAPSDIQLGLIHNNTLVFLMTFQKKDTNIWSIIRVCSILNTKIENAHQLILDYFKQSYAPQIIELVVDRRWSERPKFYNNLEFTITNTIKPVCWLFNPNDFNKYDFISLPSNSNLKHVNEVYDSGYYIWEWRK